MAFIFFSFGRPYGPDFVHNDRREAKSLAPVCGEPHPDIGK
jgi:hypothetical protein